MATMPSPAQLMEEEMHVSDTMVPNIIAANVICLTIACIAVVLRFLARRMARVRYEADDWLIVVALFFMAATVLCALLGVRYGSGRHAILLKDPAALGKLLLAGGFIWGFAVTPTKLSILYLYYRIFFVSRKFTIILCAVGIFVTCYCLTQAFASIFQCVPIYSNWTIGVKHFCVNTNLGGTITASLNAATDVVILFLPMPLLYKLQRPTKQKLEIMGIFCLGGLVCFASIYRAILTEEFNKTDPSWSDTRPEIWALVELGIGILSACLPTMYPLFSRSRGKGSSGAQRLQENSGALGSSSQSSTPPESARQPPSESQDWAHVGVLGDDVEHVREKAPENW